MKFPIDPLRASLNPILFSLYRSFLYAKYHNTHDLSQPEVIHEHAKARISKLEPLFEDHAELFDPGEKLSFRISNLRIRGPVGLAAGFDKDCEILAPMSHVFGFLTGGTVSRYPRPGNPQNPRGDGSIRFAVDNSRKALINAQGYPSKGIEFALEKIKFFRERETGSSPLFLSFTGANNVETEDAFLDASKEIINISRSYVDVFEDNRSSPGTAYNKELETPTFTRKMMELIKTHAPGTPVSMKVSSYLSLPPSESEVTNKLESIKVFHELGGDMVVLNNSRLVSTRNNSVSRNFLRNEAGESGVPLLSYTLKLIEDVHNEVPTLPIIACGGIFSGSDAWKALEAGASLVEIYSAITFRGFQVIRDIHGTLSTRLGDKSLVEYVENRDHFRQ